MGARAACARAPNRPLSTKSATKGKAESEGETAGKGKGQGEGQNKPEGKTKTEGKIKKESRCIHSQASCPKDGDEKGESRQERAGRQSEAEEVKRRSALSLCVGRGLLYEYRFSPEALCAPTASSTIA